MVAQPPVPGILVAFGGSKECFSRNDCTFTNISRVLTACLPQSASNTGSSYHCACNPDLGRQGEGCMDLEAGSFVYGVCPIVFGLPINLAVQYIGVRVSRQYTKRRIKMGRPVFTPAFGILVLLVVAAFVCTLSILCQALYAFSSDESTVVIAYTAHVFCFRPVQEILRLIAFLLWTIFWSKALGRYHREHISRGWLTVWQWGALVTVLAAVVLETVGFDLMGYTSYFTIVVELLRLMVTILFVFVGARVVGRILEHKTQYAPSMRQNLFNSPAGRKRRHKSTENGLLEVLQATQVTLRRICALELLVFLSGFVPAVYIVSSEKYPLDSGFSLGVAILTVFQEAVCAITGLVGVDFFAKVEETLKGIRARRERKSKFRSRFVIKEKKVISEAAVVAQKTSDRRRRTRRLPATNALVKF